MVTKVLNATRNRFLTAGIYVPIVFWSTLALCTTRHPGYSHLTNLVSELGAAGTTTRGLFAAGLLLCSALSLALVVGLVRECRQMRLSVVPALIILAYTFSIAGAAIFPMPLRLHGLLGSPSIGLLLSPLLALVLWRRPGSPAWLRPFAVLSVLVMSAGFLSFFPSVLGAYPGMKQRFFHAGWSIWFAYLSLGFSGIANRGRKG